MCSKKYWLFETLLLIFKIVLVNFRDGELSRRLHLYPLTTKRFHIFIGKYTVYKLFDVTFENTKNKINLV